MHSSKPFYPAMYEDGGKWDGLLTSKIWELRANFPSINIIKNFSTNKVKLTKLFLRIILGNENWAEKNIKKQPQCL